MTLRPTNGRAALAPFLTPSTAERPIQVGPDYCCFECGHPALGLVPWPVHPTNRIALDRFAHHIAYLALPKSCQRAGHASRVAKLGTAITQLHFEQRADRDRVAQQIEGMARIREALAYLAANVPDEVPLQLGEEQCQPDPITALVYRLLAGQLAPDAAIEHIRSLVEDKS